MNSGWSVYKNPVRWDRRDRVMARWDIRNGGDLYKLTVSTWHTGAQYEIRKCGVKGWKLEGQSAVAFLVEIGVSPSELPSDEEAIALDNQRMNDRMLMGLHRDVYFLEREYERTNGLFNAGKKWRLGQELEHMKKIISDIQSEQLRAELREESDRA